MIIVLLVFVVSNICIFIWIIFLRTFFFLSRSIKFGYVLRECQLDRQLLFIKNFPLPVIRTSTVVDFHFREILGKYAGKKFFISTGIYSISEKFFCFSSSIDVFFLRGLTRSIIHWLMKIDSTQKYVIRRLWKNFFHV